MTELREQIYSIVSAIGAITGETTFDEKQETPSGSTIIYPYLVFSFLSSARERADTTPTKLRFAKVQFDLIGESGLDAIVDSIETALDNISNYSFSENTLLSMFEDFRTGPLKIESDNSANLWQITFQYEFKIQEA